MNIPSLSNPNNATPTVLQSRSAAASMDGSNPPGDHGGGSTLDTRSEERSTPPASDPAGGDGGAYPFGDASPGYEEFLAASKNEQHVGPQIVDGLTLEAMRVSPRDFIMRVCADAFAGLAWIKPENADQQQRFGIIDGPHTYGPVNRTYFEQFIELSCQAARYVKPFASVSRFPGNCLRVTVHFDGQQVFDCAFPFKEAKIQ